MIGCFAAAVDGDNKHDDNDNDDNNYDVERELSW